MTIQTFVASLIAARLSTTYTLTYLVAAHSPAKAEEVMANLAKSFYGHSSPSRAVEKGWLNRTGTEVISAGPVRPISLEAFQEMAQFLPVRAEPDVLPPLAPKKLV